MSNYYKTQESVEEKIGNTQNLMMAILFYSLV